MRSGGRLALGTTAAAVALVLLAIGAPVAAHTGDGVSLEHVILEVGSWALAVTGVVAAVVAVFWVRARLNR